VADATLLRRLETGLRLGRAAEVLEALDALPADALADRQLQRLKITALESLGYDGEALEIALQLGPELLAEVARLIETMPDVVVSDALESALCELLLTRESFHPHLYDVLVDHFGAKLHRDGPAPMPLGILAGDRFFCLALEKLEFWWPDLELALTALRRRLLLETAGASPGATSLKALVHAMAVQCGRNEYAWFVDADERGALAEIEGRGQDMGPDWLGLLLMYRSPVELDAAGLVARAPASVVDGPVEVFLREALDRHARESRLAETFAGAGAVADATSARVAGMYEENPYPRWTSGLPVLNPAGWPAEKLFRIEESPAWRCRPTRPVESVLVAGSGTGLEPLSLAVALPRAHFVAIDIACRSLAYAQMMAEQYRVWNIEFQRRDILGLAAWGRDFDMVNSVGVIHHMADPAAGLRALLACLRPGGLLRLGLYSRRAREAVVRFRAASPLRRPGADRLREIRHDIVVGGEQGPYRDLLRFRDFYSLSGCRDLLAHEQETQFSIPELQALLANNHLTFLRFELLAGVTGALSDLAGAGADPCDLAGWEQAELRAPGLFAGMYIVLARFDPPPGTA
jgi:SAM-dependent methyltransferase